LRNAGIRFAMSTCLSSWNDSAPTGRIFMKFDICLYLMFWENSRFFKIWQEQQVLYMKTNTHFWSYISQFFLEWETFQTNLAEKIKTHILCLVTIFFPNSCPLWDNVGKYGRVGEATSNNVVGLMLFTYWKTKARVQSHTHNIWYLLLFQSYNICKRVTLYIYYLSWIPCGCAELKAALLTSCESVPDQRAIPDQRVDNMGMPYANMCSWFLENIAAILYSLT
jgi:hypothetical protein